MLELVKDIIRYPRILQLNRRYFEQLDSQYVSYDSWIREKEEKYLGDIAPLPLPEDVVLLVDDEDKLDENAVAVIAAAFKNPEVKVVYGDEDEFNSNHTVRMNPTFRPDYSPDTLTSYMYMGHVVAIRKSVYEEGVDIYETVVKSTAKLNRDEVEHVRYVLYHNDNSTVHIGKRPYEPKLVGDEGVSIVIPSKDNPKILSQLLKSLVKLTTGVTYEVIIIDNGSSDENQITIKGIVDDTKHKSGFALKDVKYIYSPQEFNFASICNEGASHASFEYILFLNDDVEIRDSKWLCKMMAYAVLPHVGAVGAKLYYPNSKMIQHCGITNLRLGPVHKLQYKIDDHVYYDHMADVDRDVIGVTGACLLVSKEKFGRVGGFDTRFKVAFNDVDLCFKLYEAGYYNVVVNTTHLWHYESLSRGDDESKEKIVRLQGERTLLYENHPNLYARDPFYHDYLTSDILDSNFTCRYEYDYGKNGSVTKNKPHKISYVVKDEWYNECLIISLEQCGTLEYWLGPEAKNRPDRNDIYIGGYTFIAGSDNSCFDFAILLEGEHGVYEIPCNKVYRPDLEINTDPEENTALNGFSIRPDTSGMTPGEYRVGVIARGLASRMTLCRFTNRYVKI